MMNSSPPPPPPPPPLPRMYAPAPNASYRPRPPFPPHLLQPGNPPTQPPPPRPPFFVREIYKNGYLKRLPHNEKKSSAISKLMKSDRYWVVFSVHDDLHPFFELWNEPTEVASRPPVHIYPLGVCQHISPSLVPADNEWTFVVNFETVAIRFACNSRAVMVEWVECVRNKLEDMGILNPKGNLYSKAPLMTSPPKGRNPMSPLPSPPAHQFPVTSAESDSSANSSGTSATSGSRNRLSIVDASDQANQTFTTSIYLNQTPPATPQVKSNTNTTINSNSNSTTPTKTSSKLQVNLGARPKVTTSLSLDTNKSGYETLIPKSPVVPVPTASNTSNNNTNNNSKNNSSVYLKKGSPARHVTVISINNKITSEKENNPPPPPPPLSPPENDVYTEILEPPGQDAPATSQPVPIPHRRRSPSRRQRPLSLAEDQGNRIRFSRHEEFSSNAVSKSPPKSEKKVARRYSDRRHGNESSVASKGYNIQQRIRKKSQRSSSLGPLLDEHNFKSLVHSRGANTNSLESIDSNPRQAAASHAASRGAISKRPLPNPTDHVQPLVGSPSRHMSEQHSPRPPPYPPVVPQSSTSQPSYPPHIPLPGLTYQLSLPPGMSMPQQANQNSSEHHAWTLREQQVLRLRQEIGHPSGVRLMLRKRDCHNSMALVEFFGCLWVTGWKQREFPVLYNAFHVGDQIMSAGGVTVRTTSEFQKILKSKGPSDQQQHALHIEIIIRRLPFSQVFYIRRDVDGQPLGIVLNGGTPEIKEIIPGSPACLRGMTAKVRSFDGQSFASWVITEINGRPVNLFAKDGEASERLQALGRDVAVLVQPHDVVQKMKKQLKSIRSYKDFVLS